MICICHYHLVAVKDLISSKKGKEVVAVSHAHDLTPVSDTHSHNALDAEHGQLNNNVRHESSSPHSEQMNEQIAENAQTAERNQHSAALDQTDWENYLLRQKLLQQEQQNVSCLDLLRCFIS